MIKILLHDDDKTLQRADERGKRRLLKAFTIKITKPACQTVLNKRFTPLIKACKDAVIMFASMPTPYTSRLTVA